MFFLMMTVLSVKVAWTAVGDIAWNRGGMKKEENKKMFLEKLDFLLEITSCTHEIHPCAEFGCEGCQEMVHISNCTCKKEKKIPKLELLFMRSMRAHRPPGEGPTMMMGGVDKKESERQGKLAARKLKEKTTKQETASKARSKEKELQERKTLEAETLLQEEGLGEEEQEFECDILGGGTRGETGLQKNTLSIRKTALATIRTQASNRQAAAITTGFLHDLIDGGVLPPDSQYLAVDAKKIHRAREVVMEKVQAKEEMKIEQEDIESIMVDSRITKTKVMEYNPTTAKFYSTVKKQDIYTMTDGSGRFLHHFVKEPVPEGSTMSPSQALALQIYDWCVKYGAVDTLKFLAGDSTNSNTGYVVSYY